MRHTVSTNARAISHKDRPTKWAGRRPAGRPALYTEDILFRIWIRMMAHKEALRLRPFTLSPKTAINIISTSGTDGSRQERLRITRVTGATLHHRFIEANRLFAPLLRHHPNFDDPFVKDVRWLIEEEVIALTEEIRTSAEVRLSPLKNCF